MTYVQVYEYTTSKLKILLIYWHILVHMYGDCNELVTATSEVKCWGTNQILLRFYEPKYSQQWLQKPAEGQYIEPTKSVWIHPSILFLYGKLVYSPQLWLFLPSLLYTFLISPMHSMPRNSQHPYTVNLFSSIRVKDQVSEPYKMGKNKWNHTWKVDFFFQKYKLQRNRTFYLNVKDNQLTGFVAQITYQPSANIYIKYDKLKNACTKPKLS
jgi:hypothetical protein